MKLPLSDDRLDIFVLSNDDFDNDCELDVVDVFELSPRSRRNRKLAEEEEVDTLDVDVAPDDERKLNSYGYRCRIRGGGEYVQFILDDEDFVGLARCKYEACDERGRCGKAIIEIIVD